MRFIYEFNNKDRYYDFVSQDVRNCIWSITHTIEDTLLEIVWIIEDYKSYEEMREYYVKG